MSSSADILTRMGECGCETCAALRFSRTATSNIPVEHMNLLGEYEAVGKVVEVGRLLAEAQNLVHKKHNAAMYGTQNGAIHSPQGSSPEKAPYCASQNKQSGTPSQASSVKENGISPAKRQVTNLWEGRTAAAPLNANGNVGPAPNAFMDHLRAKAAELGILNGQPPPVETPPPASNTLTVLDKNLSPMKEKSKFVVCDHCRSHGIRCNEASVCKECILRQVPCTHRQCDLSPNSRDDCPRQVCFYVHGDWMPDVYGNHNPQCANWIILPGKIRELHSAGQLSKLPQRDEQEVMRVYQRVTARQQDAVKEMAKCVQVGIASWENISMQCACVEIQREEEAARVAEENVKNLHRMSLAGSF